jgi:excisionase family DNA binding protein
MSIDLRLELEDALEPVTPTADEALLARESSTRLAPLAQQGRPLHLSANGTDLQLPRAAVIVLLRLLGEMARGHPVVLVPLYTELTTQQAADMLGVSRPFVVKLMEQGKLPFTKAGSHRRIRFSDLMAFKQANDKARRRTLDQMTAESQELGLP